MDLPTVTNKFSTPLAVWVLMLPNSPSLQSFLSRSSELLYTSVFVLNPQNLFSVCCSPCSCLVAEIDANQARPSGNLPHPLYTALPPHPPYTSGTPCFSLEQSQLYFHGWNSHRAFKHYFPISESVCSADKYSLSFLPSLRIN